MSAAFGLPDHMAQAGSCFVCLTGTDTGIAFRGDLEWITAGLTAIGAPMEQAVATVEQFPPPQDDRGHYQMVRVCASCIEAHAPQLPRPKLVLPGAELDCITQPGGGSR